MPVGVGGDLVVVVAGVRGGQQVLGAVLDPAQRVIALERQRRQHDLLGVEPRLRAEPAADIGRDDAQAALLDIEDLAERDADRMRRLGRGINHDLVEPVVAISQDGAAFERRAGLPVHAVFAGDRDLGGAGGGLDIAALDVPLQIEVVAPAVVHEMAAAAPHLRRVDRRFQHLELDGDRIGEILRLAAGRRDAGGDRLADIAHLVGGERRPRRRFGAGRLGHDPDRLKARQIGRGIYPALRLRWHRDRADPGVGMRAAQKGDLLDAGQADVRHELAAAIEVPLVLLAQQRGADTASGRGLGFRHDP